MKKLYLIAAATAMLAACATGHRKPTEYCGTYSGTFMDRNGGEIASVLQLNKDNSFNSIMNYKSTPNQIFTEQGNYSVSGNTLKIVPFNGEPAYYQIEKNQLRRMNNQRHLVTGPLGNNYILKQTSCCK